MALNWLIEHHIGTVLICTDSQALLRVIDSYADSVLEVIDLPNKTAGLGLTLQWVPGHCGVLGNEMAGQQAKEAISLWTPPSRPVSLASAFSCMKKLPKIL